MQNKLIIIILIIISSFSCNRIEKQNIVELDIQSYDIKILLDTNKRNLEIETIIKLEKPDTLKKVFFLFSDLAIINDIKLNNDKINLFVHKNDTLFFDLLPEEIIKITVKYTLPTDSFENNGNVLLTRPMRWCPFVYDDISTLKTKIFVPEDYVAFSSGIPTNKNFAKNTYKTYNELNAGLPIIITKNDYYTEFSKLVDNIEIKFYFHNNDSALANSIIDECVKTVKFCNNYIGNYNKEKLTFIEFPNAFYCQSLETFLLAGDGFIKYYNHPEMRFWVSHETIHQWIGAGYFNTLYKNNKLRWFIEESFTEYIRYQFNENRFGADSLNNQLKWAINTYYKEIKGTEQDITIAENKPTRVVYVVGPLIFHWIRTEIGDEKWEAFVKTLYKENYGLFVDYTVFKETLKEYVSIETIEKCEKWLETKGIPTEIEEMISP